MKILMFGRGVIASQYGWALEQAGHKVEFYVRPGRMAEYGPSIDLDLLDGRKRRSGVPIKTRWPIAMREEWDSKHDYDLIIVSVNHNQFTEAASLIGPRAGNATILVFNNIWDEPRSYGNLLPLEQTLWGFPGGGGGFRDKQALEGAFMKPIFLESEASSASPARHRAVASLFRGAGFSVLLQKDMTVWYWVHFIMNAGMAAGALKHGSFGALYGSPQAMGETILLMREMLPLIKARGRKVDWLSGTALRLPSRPLGYVAHRVMSGQSLASEIMARMERTGYIPKSSYSLYPEDVLKEARKLSVSLPRLEAFERYWA